MNVYAIKASGRYGGGMAVVAAEDESAARLIGETIQDRMWRTDYSKGDIELLPCQCAAPARVIFHYEVGE